MDKWRLIVDKKRSGEENMAVDEALMKSVKNGESLPTIRFYTWDPPCVTLGYFQKASKEVNFESCRQLGFDVVRRATGGRAVLHDDELTYSVIVSENHNKIPREIVQAYKVLSKGLMIGLNEMGLSAKMSELSSESNRKGSAACFDAPSWYELVVQGKKVIGSAQVRKEGILLQHGSIPVTIDLELLLKVLQFPSKEVRDRTEKILLKKAGGIRDVSPKDFSMELTIENLIHYFSKGFETALDMRLIPGELTKSEQETVNELVENKYGTDDWNLKK